MNKYVYSVSSSDRWPVLETVMATNLLDAEDKVISKFYENLELDDDCDNYKEFQEEMNSHDILISDLYDYETL